MTSAATDSMLRAWLTARSIARDVPAPVPDHGGYRVDTNSDIEVRRWIFQQPVPGLIELGRTIRAPRHLLKLCGAGDQLLGALPEGWQLHAPGYFMIGDDFMMGDRASRERPPPPGYSVETCRSGAVSEVRVMSGAGDLAASGFAAETREAFIYDRIVTAPEHRRKGLGHIVMAALHRAKRASGTPELLVATEDGRALYETLGWRVVSPFSTASR